jgi:ABC-type oligopeptide transport system substrate-binding subunit
VFSFNLQQREVADVRVRQALSMAIDREVLTQTVTKLGEPIAWSLLPALPGYQPYQPGESALPRSERLARAAELLKAVGVGPDHPLHLVITYNTSGNHKRLAEAIALMWQPLGIETELRNLSWGDYQSAKSAGDFTVARSFVFGDYAEPSAVLNQFRCGDPQNESGYCDPQFDRLLTDAANTLDESLRNQFYQQAEQLMMSAQPVIPLFHYSQMRLISPQLRGLPTQNVRGVIASKDLYFAQQQ